MEFVLEFTSPDRFTSGSDSGGISCLDHELLDHTVELGSLVATDALLALGQLGEVLDSLGDGITEETDLNPASGLISNGDVKVNLEWKTIA